MDSQKYSIFKQTYCNNKNYPYLLADLNFLTRKTSIFLLDQFQNIFQSINQRKSEPSSSISKGKKRKRFSEWYNSITMDVLNIAKLPLGYSTGYSPVSE